MSAKLFDECLADIQSRKSWRGTESMDLADLSSAEIDLLLQVIAAGAPIVKARRYRAEVKRIERAAPALERLDQDMREVKAKQMRDLFDPDLTRLGLIKRGPLNWQ